MVKQRIVKRTVSVRPRRRPRRTTTVVTKPVRRTRRQRRQRVPLAPINRVRPRRVRRGNRTQAIKGNAFEPAMRPNIRTAGTYNRRTLEVPTSLEPSCRFALACLNPAGIVSPFVENGTVADLPTQQLCGTYAFTPTVLVTDTDAYTMFSVSVLGNLLNGVSPVQAVYTNNVNSNYTNTHWDTGLAFTTVFGNTPYADRIGIWAAELNLEVLTPAANLQGVVHVGTISYAAARGGVTIQQLKLRATHRLDLKQDSSRVINLRCAIQNEAAIHAINNGGVVSSMADEYIAYAIYQNVAQGIGTGSPSGYQISANVACQAVYWPAGGVPAMAGVAASSMQLNSEIISKNVAVAERQALAKDIAQENAQLLRKLNHYPMVLPNLPTFVSTCLAGKSVQTLFNEIMINHAPSVAAVTGAKAIESPFILLPQVEDDIYNLDWNLTQAQKTYHFDFWSPDALTLFDEIEDRQAELIDLLRTEVQERRDLYDRLNLATQVIQWEHGTRVLRWKEGDNYIDVDSIIKKWDHDTTEFEMAPSEPDRNLDLRKPSPTPSKVKAR